MEIYELLIDIPSLVLVFVPAVVCPFLLHFRLKPALAITSLVVLPIGCLGAQIGLISVLGQLSEPGVLPLVMAVDLLTMLYASVVYLCLPSNILKELSLSPNPPMWRRFVSLIVYLAVFTWGILMGGDVSIFLNAAALACVITGFGTATFFLRWRNKRTNSEWTISKLLKFSIVGSVAGLLVAIANQTNPQLIGPAISFSICLSTYATFLYVCTVFFHNFSEQTPQTTFVFGWEKFLLFGLVSIVAPAIIIGLALG